MDDEREGLVEVTQADRDCLAHTTYEMGLLSALSAEHIRRGLYDNDCAFIARHRLAALTKPASDGVRERIDWTAPLEAINRFTKEVRPIEKPDNDYNAKYAPKSHAVEDDFIGVWNCFDWSGRNENPKKGPWDIRNRLAALPADQVKAERWQPIETFDEPTAMSSTCGVLVATAEGVGEAYFRNFGGEDDGWWWANTSWGDYPEPTRPNPTHWQPLPATPTPEQSNEA